MNVSTESDSTRAWVEVSLNNLAANARDALAAARGAKLLPMVKANAYGIGVVRAVQTLEPFAPWAYGVATVAEAEEIRNAGIDRPIVVFTPARADQLPAFAAARAEPVLEQPDVIRSWMEPFHIEVDTGMGRGGIPWDADDLLGAALRLGPRSVFTHLHSADDAPQTIERQLERFRTVVDRVDRHRTAVHVGNSAGTFRLAEHWDLIRPGIFLYGGRIGPDQPEPAPVVAVRARVVSVRRLPAGESVSYGAEWTAKRDTTVATVGIGYADGVRRAVAGRAVVLCRGRRYPVIGRITMDMIMVDLEDDPVERGEVVTVIGTDGDTITVDEFASWAGTISYEILTGLGARLPRLYAD